MAGDSVSPVNHRWANTIWRRCQGDTGRLAHRLESARGERFAFSERIAVKVGFRPPVGFNLDRDPFLATMAYELRQELLIAAWPAVGELLAAGRTWRELAQSSPQARTRRGRASSTF